MKIEQLDRQPWMLRQVVHTQWIALFSSRYKKTKRRANLSVNSSPTSTSSTWRGQSVPNPQVPPVIASKKELTSTRVFPFLDVLSVYWPRKPMARPRKNRCHIVRASWLWSLSHSLAAMPRHLWWQLCLLPQSISMRLWVLCVTLGK